MTPEVFNENRRRRELWRLLHDRTSLLLGAILMAVVCIGFVVLIDNHLTPDYSFWVRAGILAVVSIPSLVVVIVFIWACVRIRRSDYGL